MNPKYHATLPLGQPPNSAKMVAEEAFPYAVSIGTFKNDDSLVGTVLSYVGILFHLTAWIMALVSDIMIKQDIDEGADATTHTDKKLYDYWAAGITSLCLALGMVLVLVVLHLTGLYKQDKITAPVPASMEMFIRGGILASAVMAFIMSGYESTGLVGGAGKEQDFRSWLVVSLLCKVTLISIANVNFRSRDD